eukprot:TRINITY_DN8174_c0_g1_i6.p1 TRINITY_DN8174_c0_g1~~TRINITY_DN8174_c0_g1_i6.p1  ORF type:complete len:100 (+),score=26.14 TRINITY_DN8174_c0_g1_i6:97-396(+)
MFFRPIVFLFFFFLMIRRPPRSTLSSSSAASDVYKRQILYIANMCDTGGTLEDAITRVPVSYTHLRAHETPEHLVCRLLLEKKKKKTKSSITIFARTYK